MPRLVPRLDTGDEALTELGVLVGFDDDLAGQATRTSNRIRGLLTSIHPALERVLGPLISHPAVLEILSRCGGPAGIRAAGKRKLTTIATEHAPRMDTRLVDEVLAALPAQTVTVPGAKAAEVVLPKLADALRFGRPPRLLRRDRPGHPPIRQLHPRESPARSGNHKLERALFLSAFAALHDPASRTYHDRKHAEGKNHNTALVCLARRRCDVLYAMLKTKQPYRNPLVPAST